jgi:ABC-2 type transport system ATP-binding protein
VESATKKEYILESRNVYKSYTGKIALSDVSLTVPKGSIYGLLGPNGAGKTTFIRIITQIIGADTGEILFSGKKLHREDIYRMGYMPEERGLYKKMKVGEQLMYLARLKGLSRTDADRRLKYWLEALQIKDWWNKRVEELSKGMQQKIQFVATVIHEPELIILDEPFTGFDPVNSAIIRDEILKLQQKGTTIILSTHRMESVEELCDNISLFNRSKKIIEGTVEEVRQSFKEHAYEMVIGAPLEELPLEGMEDIFNFKLDSVETLKNNVVHIRFKVGEELTTNEVIQRFMPFGQLISFKEVLPSMNDIFIKLVKESRL